MKCDICTKKIQTTFLEKVLGTYIRDKDRKKKLICSDCQKSLKDKGAILEKL